MSLVQILDQTIAQLSALREHNLDNLQGALASAKSKLADLERKVKATEEVKARVLAEVTSLKQQVEKLRADKLAERQARQDIIDKAREELNDLNAEHRAKIGTRDSIASAIAELKVRLQ
jgi:chromosome segregation ATPase